MRAVRSRLDRNAHLLSGSVACLLKSATTAHRPSSRLVGWHCTTSLLSMRLCGELGIQAGDRILAILCSERRTVTNLRRWLPCRLEAGCREGMTISVAQRKAIYLVAQMLRCDTAKKLRHSQSKGSRTSKMEQFRSRVIDRRCARCSRVQDGARPCRSASCTSTAASAFTTVSLSVEHGGAERRGFCRSHLHPPRAAPSCCGSAAARCSATRTQRPAQRRPIQRGRLSTWDKGRVLYVETPFICGNDRWVRGGARAEPRTQRGREWQRTRACESSRARDTHLDFV